MVSSSLLSPHSVTHEGIARQLKGMDYAGFLFLCHNHAICKDAGAVEVLDYREPSIVDAVVNAVKSAGGTFVGVVVHVLDIRGQRPIHRFGAEDDIAVSLKQGLLVPGLVYRPAADRLCQNEGSVDPFCDEFSLRQVNC